MTISDKNTSFSIVLKKGLKHKLQVLSDSEKRSLGSYISNILEEHVTFFENTILSTYGTDDFDDIYIDIFGTEHDPSFFANEYEITHNKEEMERKLNKLIRSTSRGKVVKVSNARDDSPTE